MENEDVENRSMHTRSKILGAIFYTQTNYMEGADRREPRRYQVHEDSKGIQ
jgi:hypothetical protein